MLVRFTILFDRLARLLARIIRNRLDELNFVIVLIICLSGIVLLGDVVAGHVGFYIGAGFGVLLVGVCGLAFNRGLALRRRENVSSDASGEDAREEGRDETPGSFLLGGLLQLAFYGVGLLASGIYPSLHPIHGETETRIGFGLILSLAAGHLLVGLAGLLDARVCLVFGENRGKRPLPLWIRFAGWFLYLSGIAIGGCIAFLVGA
jgi:hypothetical protein